MITVSLRRRLAIPQISFQKLAHQSDSLIRPSVPQKKIILVPVLFSFHFVLQRRNGSCVLEMNTSLICSSPTKFLSQKCFALKKKRGVRFKKYFDSQQAQLARNLILKNQQWLIQLPKPFLVCKIVSRTKKVKHVFEFLKRDRLKLQGNALLDLAVRLIFEFSRTFLTMGISRKLLMSRIQIYKPQFEKTITVFTSTY